MLTNGFLLDERKGEYFNTYFQATVDTELNTIPERAGGRESLTDGKTHGPAVGGVGGAHDGDIGVSGGRSDVAILGGTRLLCHRGPPHPN